MSATATSLKVEHTPQVFMMHPTLGAEMMFSSNHERYYHSNQFLLLGSHAGTSHGRSTIRLLVGRGETGSDPDELVCQIIVTEVKVAYP
jgi:hypothetical protein